MTSSPAWCELSPAASLFVSGSDADTFLQGQVTQDVRQATADRAVYALWLDRRGKVLADSWLWRAAGGWNVVSHETSADGLRARIEEFVVADDVVVADHTPHVAGLVVWGGEAGQALRGVGLPVGTVPGAVATGALGAVPAVALRGRRSPGAVEVFVPRAQRDGLLEEVGRRWGPASDAEALERARLEAGWARVPTDCGPSDLPQEAGLEAVALSYEKGCYLGQEAMARVRALGRLRRRLVRLEGTGRLPARGTGLFVGAARVGEVRSGLATAAGWVALAYVNTNVSAVALATEPSAEPWIPLPTP
jgi:folate-binding protein YgfZ